MPPRKRAKNDSDEEAANEFKPKKAKTASKTPLDPSVPTNTTLPDPLTLPAKPDGSTRISVFNVAGLKAAIKKGLTRYVDAEEADILIMTETKCEEQNTPESLFLRRKYPYRYYGVDTQKGYSGTAILCKTKPLSVVKGLPTLAGHTESRFVTAEYEHCYVVGTYCPNAGEKLKNMDAKERWNAAFEEHIRVLDAKKPVIIAGDLNVAPTAADLRNATTNWNKTAGYTEKECRDHRKLISPPAESGHKPLVDVWRSRNPDAVGHYSYYGFTHDKRSQGIGWRLDFFLLSERLMSRVLNCEHRYSVYGLSDHVPVILDISGDL